MDLYPVLKGMATYVPFLYRATRGNTGGSVDARYCYSVWLRHLIRVHDAGLPDNPKTVAELGPGDSLGIGLAAMLTGADCLLALDVVRYADTDRNHAIVDAIVELIRRREPVPQASEFPGLFPPLASYEFPGHILTDERLARSLGPERVDAIHAALRVQQPVGALCVRYVVPWDVPSGEDLGAIDLIISQAVLEHVEDLPKTYDAFLRWLKPGGTMSHVIDFRSHRITAAWDGHRQYPGWLWRVVRGRRPYLLNRIGLAAHLQLQAERGFELKSLVRDRREATLPRARLAAEFRQDSEEDRATASAAFIAVRGPHVAQRTAPATGRESRKADVG
jgi:hypothetical protein